MTMTQKQQVSTSPILVITKDSGLLRALYRILGDSGNQLRSVEKVGRGAKKIINEINPKLIIVDIMMPLMRGVSIAMRIHEWSSARTVLLTSWRTEDDSLRRLDITSATGLSDPIKPEDLAEWITGIIKKQNSEIS